MTLTYAQRLQQALANQHKKCFDYDKKELKPEYAERLNCPVCGSSDAKPFYNKDWFIFTRCDNCTMVYLNPRLTEQATYDFYNSDWNAIYNETKFDAVSDATRLDDEINHGNLDRITRHLGTRRGILLEIGCGNGYFLRKARAAGFQVHGLELNEKNCAKVRQELGETVRNEDLFSARYPDELFDVVYMRDVFEHVPNPREMMAEISRISKPGALLFIEVPNIDGCIYKLVKERHVCVFGFEHLNYWSAATLKKLITLEGYQAASVSYSSLDFTWREVFRTLLQPSFTTLFPRRTSLISRWFFQSCFGVLDIWPLRSIDHRITPAVANLLNRGSVVKFLAIKTR